MVGSFVEAEFDNLDSCLEHIRKNYPDDQTCRTQAFDPDSNEQYEKTDAPAFLYRGEPEIYPTTKSSIMRLKELKGSCLSEEAKEKIECLTLAANFTLMQLFESPDIHKLDSLAFLQHYGMPTQIIDFTSKLEVAASFAKGCENEKSEEGVIGVLPTPKEFDRHRIFDLSGHPLGARPKKQRAYGFHSEYILDLKNSFARDKMKIKWFSFKKAPIVINSFKSDLLSLQEDGFAGIIKAILDSFPKQEDEVARWLADHVSPSPLVVEVKSYYDSNNRQPKEIDFVPAGSTFKEDEERENNYKRWSLGHPDRLMPKDGKWRLGQLLPMDFDTLPFAQVVK